NAIRQREVMLIVVDELQVVLVRDIEVEPERREPADVAARVLEGQVFPIEIVVSPDAAYEYAFGLSIGNQAQRFADLRVNSVCICPSARACGCDLKQVDSDDVSDGDAARGD